MGARSSQSRGPGPNKTDGHLLEYFRQNFSGGGGGTNPPPEVGPQGITATGGLVTDYTLDLLFIEHMSLRQQEHLM